MKYYNYLGTKWWVKHENELKTPLLDEYFHEIQDTTWTHFGVTTTSSTYNDLEKVLENGVPIIIHNSKKPEIHEVGSCYDDGYTRTIFNRTTRSVYKLNYISSEITIFNKDISFLERDYIRVTRDIVKSLMEFNRNGVMYHAAALKGPNNQGILLIGSKKSGKTTTSLNLIYNHGFTEISRDRTFLTEENGNLIMNGWPNYYNLTLGTIASFENLRYLLPEKYKDYSFAQLNNINEKVQYLGDDLNISNNSLKHRLSHVFFLDSEGEGEDIYDKLAVNCYSPNDLNYPNWHDWVDDRIKVKKNAYMFSKQIFKSSLVSNIKWQANVSDKIDEILNLCE